MRAALDRDHHGIECEKLLGISVRESCSSSSTRAGGRISVPKLTYLGGHEKRVHNRVTQIDRSALWLGAAALEFSNLGSNATQIYLFQKKVCCRCLSCRISSKENQLLI
jgi:hypothetical protein